MVGALPAALSSQPHGGGDLQRLYDFTTESRALFDELHALRAFKAAATARVRIPKHVEDGLLALVGVGSATLRTYASIVGMGGKLFPDNDMARWIAALAVRVRAVEAQKRARTPEERALRRRFGDTRRRVDASAAALALTDGDGDRDEGGGT